MDKKKIFKEIPKLNDITFLDVTIDNDILIIDAKLQTRVSTCNRCGAPLLSKGLLHPIYTDIPFNEHKVLIRLSYQKLRCSGCGCYTNNSYSMELSKKHRTTKRLEQHIWLLMKQNNRERVSQLTGISTGAISSINSDFMKKYEVRNNYPVVFTIFSFMLRNEIYYCMADMKTYERFIIEKYDIFKQKLCDQYHAITPQKIYCDFSYDTLELIEEIFPQSIVCISPLAFKNEIVNILELSLVPIFGKNIMQNFDLEIWKNNLNSSFPQYDMGNVETNKVNNFKEFFNALSELDYFLHNKITLKNAQQFVQKLEKYSYLKKYQLIKIKKFIPYLAVSSFSDISEQLYLYMVEFENAIIRVNKNRRRLRAKNVLMGNIPPKVLSKGRNNDIMCIEIDKTDLVYKQTYYHQYFLKHTHNCTIELDTYLQYIKYQNRTMYNRILEDTEVYYILEELYDWFKYK